MTILILKETGEKKDFVHDIDARVAIERGWEVYARDVVEVEPEPEAQVEPEAKPKKARAK